MVPFPIMFYAILFPKALSLFEQVSQASPRPVLSCHFHQVMTLFFSAAEMGRFFSVENLVGGRESSLEEILARIRAAGSKPFSVFAGTCFLLTSLIASAEYGVPSVRCPLWLPSSFWTATRRPTAATPKKRRGSRAESSIS